MADATYYHSEQAKGASKDEQELQQELGMFSNELNHPFIPNSGKNTEYIDGKLVTEGVMLVPGEDLRRLSNKARQHLVDTGRIVGRKEGGGKDFAPDQTYEVRVYKPTEFSESEALKYDANQFRSSTAINEQTLNFMNQVTGAKYMNMAYDGIRDALSEKIKDPEVFRAANDVVRGSLMEIATGINPEASAQAVKRLKEVATLYGITIPGLE
jgi:hypothetical protein